MLRRQLHRYILFILLFILCGIGLVGEKIPVNNNTGWDGKNYASLTLNFEELALQHQISSYQYQRIFAPAFIHYAAKLLGVKLTIDNIPLAYSIYNLLLILLSVILFFKLCTYLNIGKAAEIIGFSGLFLNYFILKNTSYYPVLTDSTAFFAGMFFTYCFITRRNVALVCAMLLAQFCYPMLLVVSIPLALLVRNNYISLKLDKTHFNKIIAMVISGIVLIGTYNILFVPDTLLEYYTMQHNVYVLPVSIILLLIYIWLTLSKFQNASNDQDENVFNWKLPVGMLLLFGAFLIVINKAIGRISLPEDVFTPKVFLYNVLQQAIDNPLVFLIAHIIYLGPLLLLVLFLYKPFLRIVSSFGDSALAYFLIIILLSIGSETRQFIHVYPFIVVIMMVTIDQMDITVPKAVAFVVLSLIVSKYWLSINEPGIYTQYIYDKFPEQRYFMNHGPFMSDASYLINLFVVIGEGALIWLLFFRKKEVIS
jgi:hypothetical protein